MIIESIKVNGAAVPMHQISTTEDGGIRFIYVLKASTSIHENKYLLKKSKRGKAKSNRFKPDFKIRLKDSRIAKKL